jgi:hypothetical protein
MQAVSNCWICEGWSEVEFRYVPPHKVDTDLTPVKLHLQCDDFKGELLQCYPVAGSNDQMYVTKRMLPPGSHQYYYTVDNEPQVDPTQTKHQMSATTKHLKHLLTIKIPYLNYIS